MNLDVPGRTVKKLDPVEVGGLGDVIDLGNQLVHLLLERLAVVGSHAAGGRLNRQLAHPLQHIGDFAQCALGGLHHRDAVVGVLDRHRHTAQIGRHTGADRKTRGVVLGSVDPLAGRQLLHRRGEAAIVDSQRVLSRQRLDVGVDHRHLAIPLKE